MKRSKEKKAGNEMANEQNDEMNEKNGIEEEKVEEQDLNENELLNESEQLLMIELEAKNTKLNEQENEIKDLKESLLRKAAEFENYKRRTENEQLNFMKYAAEAFIVNILPVYSDFERSLDHINDENNASSVKEGIKLLFQKFKKTMEDQGVKKIDAKGKPFDFNLHEALMQQPSEGVPAHTVLEVIEPGYMYKDKVIKHAKVVVSQELSQTENKEKDN